MDILIIISQMIQVIALVAGIGAFRYVTDEIRRLEQLFSDRIRRLEQTINDQAIVLNELKSVCKMNKSSDNNLIALKILDVLTKMQIAPVPKLETVPEKRKIPEPRIPQRELKPRSNSAELDKVFDILGT